MKYYYHDESDSFVEFTEEEVENLIAANSIDFAHCMSITEEEYRRQRLFTEEEQEQYYNRRFTPTGEKENTRKMSTNLNDNQVVTGEVRFSYVNVFEARKFKDTDKEAKYSLTILIPKNTPAGQKTIALIKQAIQKAAEKGAQKHFGGRIPTNVNNTLRDGDTETDDLGELKKLKNPELAGNMFMRLSTKYKPKVLNAQNQEILNPLEIYSGCWGKVSLTCYAYSGDGKRGISAVLNNVKMTRDGEPLTSHLSGDELEADE